MLGVCKKLNLKKRHTNHCMRVTTVVAFKEQEFDNHVISLVTSHEDVLPVTGYVKKRKDDSYFKTLLSFTNLNFKNWQKMDSNG